METNVNYTIVGVFVISILSAIVIAIIWLSSGFSFAQYKLYMVYMQESVSGLSTDSPVEYNGVIVGSVKSIDLNHKDPQLVELLLNIKTSTSITRGTVATLNTRGLTGLTFVALKDKSTDLRPLKEEPGEPYPIIPTAPSFFVRLDTALSQLTKSIKSVSHSFELLLNDANQSSIKNILINLQNFTEGLAANNEKLNVIMQNTAKASAQFAPLMETSVGMVKTLKAQTLPGTSQLLNNLNEATHNLSQIIRDLKQNPSIILRGVDKETLGPGETK